MKSTSLYTLGKTTRKALEKLDSSPFFNETAAYLAGGSGLAIHLGHRYSYDLDFFTRKDFHEDYILDLLDESGKFKLERRGWKTILGTFEDIKLSLFFYKYPLLLPPKKIFSNTNLASLKDIAAMKVAAISDRGTKRDFIDLYFLLSHFPLEKILKYYDQKYQNLGVNRIHILKSLVYFADAEKDTKPKMIQAANWEEVKNLIKEKVKSLRP